MLHRGLERRRDDRQRSTGNPTCRPGCPASDLLSSCPRRSPKDRAKPPFLRTLRGLRVDDRYRRTCLTSFLLAHRDIERVVDTLQRAIPVPQLQIIVHCTLWRQIFRQRLPLASRPQDVEDSIQHLAHVHRPFAPTMSRWRDHGLHDRPFGIGQITGVTKATAVRRKAVFGCPHRALLKRESSARQGITSDSSDSRTSRIGSKGLTKEGSLVTRKWYGHARVYP